MSPTKGRPPIENPKNVRLEIRLTHEQAKMLADCAEQLNTTKTDVINMGIKMVKDELDKK